MKANPRVTIIYKYIPQYRKEFFEILREELNRSSVELTVIYGQPGKEDSQKGDSVDLSWGIKVRNNIFNIGRKELYWQPVVSLLKESDLVVVEQASKLLINYYLILLNLFGLKRVAFWGHGKNFQTSSQNKIAELVKRIVSTKVHWWFAYTEKSAEILSTLGFPQSRVTVVQNAIDTQELVRMSQETTSAQLLEIRCQLKITSEHVGLYVGGMYKEKNLDFLLSACELIHNEVPDFQMVFIGSGIEAIKIQNQAKLHSWIKYIGPKFKRELVPYFQISKVFLMPGLVGLAILDCFALGVPLITTQHENHSPEIDYLQNGVNGIIVADSANLQEYANTVIDLLNDEVKRLRLVKGCKESASKYTIEQMVDNFAQGVLKAIAER